MADLVLAMIIASVTFKVAYRASVVLGTVLLQTSPPRGLASGKMEAFLRAMREVCLIANLENKKYGLNVVGRSNGIPTFFTSLRPISGN